MNYFNQNSIAKRIAGKLSKKQGQMEEVDGQMGSAPVESGIYVIADIDEDYDDKDGTILAKGTKERLKEAWWNLIEQQGSVGGWTLVSEEEFNDQVSSTNDQASGALHDQLYEGTGGFPKIR